MGLMRRRIVILSFAVLMSPAILVGSADAASLVLKQVNELFRAVNKLFATADPQAALMIADMRENLPKDMANYSQQVYPTLTHETDEIQSNIDDHKKKTGETGVPIWPQNSELMAILTPLMKASFDLSFQAKLAPAYSPYLTVLQGIADSLTPPESPPEGSPPFVPPLSGLSSGAAYFRGEAALIKKGAEAFAGITVSAGSSALDFEQSLTAAQGRINAARGIHPMADGAAEGLVNGLGELKKIAKKMQDRYDYYNADLLNLMADLANQTIQTNASQALNEIAEFVTSMAKTLEDGIVSIQKSEGGTDATGALAAVNGLIQQVTMRKAAAEAAVAGLAVQVADLTVKAYEYYTKLLMDKHRHCYHEVIVYDSLSPLYSMQDDFRNMQSPQYVMAQLNADMWESLKGTIIPGSTQLNSSIAAKVKSTVETAARQYGLPYASGDPIPGVPQFRFTAECGIQVEDPGTAAASVADVQASLNRVRAAALRVNREVTRRVRATKVATCAPTNRKCLKKAKEQAQIKKRIERDRKKLSKSSKKLLAELPARLNKAYFTLYGKYPYSSFR